MLHNGGSLAENAVAPIKTTAKRPERVMLNTSFRYLYSPVAEACFDYRYLQALLEPRHAILHLGRGIGGEVDEAGEVSNVRPSVFPLKEASELHLLLVREGAQVEVYSRSDSGVYVCARREFRFFCTDASGGRYSWSRVRARATRDGQMQLDPVNLMSFKLNRVRFMQGVSLVDWGRSIDLPLFAEGVEFVGDSKTDGFWCTEMIEKKPWVFQGACKAQQRLC